MHLKVIAVKVMLVLNKGRDMFKFRKDKVYEKTDDNFIIKEIERFKVSKRKYHMIQGERYYNGFHDILKRKREAVGENGELTEIKTLPNNKIVDNQYKKMVDQKANYLLGKPFSIQCDNVEYAKKLSHILDKGFMRIMKIICEDSLNCGIGWIGVYYNEQGDISFRRYNPLEIIPGFSDSLHTKLDYVIRIYEVVQYVELEEKIVTKVEVYDDEGINYFALDGRKLIPDNPYHKSNFKISDVDFNWDKVPIIPFKYNSKEIPLIKMVKSLQDGLNIIESNFLNQMQEDTHNSILVVVNYEGENLGDFRKNLATYGAVHVRSDSDGSGDVRALNIDVNAANYEVILEIFKKAIIENAMGYDAKDDRLSGNANQMNIQSMYNDIDLDANGMEIEYQASFEQIIWFINCHLYNTGQGDFFGEQVEIIFNRDMLMNESDIIDNIAKSMGLLSNETLIAQHPWVDDPLAEKERMEKESEVNNFGFTPDVGAGENDE